MTKHMGYRRQTDLRKQYVCQTVQQPSGLTHECWVRQTDDWIPAIVMNAKGKATRVYLTSTRPTSVWCPAHFPVVIWLPHGMLPPEGYVRLNSAKYRDWQVLAYELAIDNDWLYKEQELYANWLSRQPLAVERKPYHWPKGVNERPHEAKKGKQLTCTERWAAVDTEKEVNDAQEAVAESNRSYSDDQKGLAELEGINSAIEPSSECRNQQGVMREERCTSPWDSPIVIVLKKNGVDIRLCINYKMVNALTTIMEYAMPLVNDLLSELEKYLWFCSLDAANGFWAVMMTSRARRISAFVCALGHFE
ncbi:Reverse transcriptase [Phytophthora palmivora]|uniref:Reverse transcriptase n=1 Tax=Phytophthora palmivora TaxID=4796 RepID=A0A2P4Y3Z0_9STRA|nr:Reverse transcriptase [Phytophthora palmivora]